MGSSLPVGSLAVAVPQKEYFVGDVVTFKIPNSGELLTHRVESVKVSRWQCVTAEDADAVRVYKTRGDANNVADDWELASADIVGKVVFHLPYLGYLLRLPQILVATILTNPKGW